MASLTGTYTYSNIFIGMLTETTQCYSKTRQLVNRRKPQAFGRQDAGRATRVGRHLGSGVKLN